MGDDILGRNVRGTAFPRTECPADNLQGAPAFCIYAIILRCAFSALDFAKKCKDILSLYAAGGPGCDDTVRLPTYVRIATTLKGI